MRQQEKELLVARIMSGYSRLNIDGQIYLLYPPTPEEQYNGQELYNDIYNESVMGGMLTEEQIFGMLIDFELWDAQKEEEIEGLEKTIEDCKVRLYDLIFKTVERELARKHLIGYKKRFSQLQEIKHSYDYVTAEGLASLARTRYLLSCGLRTKDRKKYWSGDFYNQPDPIIDAVMEEYYRNLIDEKDYRELARTEPWRMTWGLKKTGSPIVHSSCDKITNEQKVLFFWSIIYDSIYENSDCPPESVIQDDDMMDGWLILQRRKREDAIEKQRIEKSSNISDKIKNAQEIYIMAQGEEGIRNVDKLNDEYGKAMKRQRMATLRKAGEMNELDMPDTKRELQMQVTQKLRDRFK